MHTICEEFCQEQSWNKSSLPELTKNRFCAIFARRVTGSQAFEVEVAAEVLMKERTSPSSEIAAHIRSQAEADKVRIDNPPYYTAPVALR